MYEKLIISKSTNSDNYCSIYHSLHTAIEKEDEKEAYAIFRKIISKGCSVNDDDAIDLVNLLAKKKEKVTACKIFLQIKNIRSTVFDDLIDQIFGKSQSPVDAGLAAKMNKISITSTSNFVGVTSPNDNYCELRVSLHRTLEKAKLLAEAKNAYNIFKKIINNGQTLDLDDTKKLLNLLINKNLIPEAAKVFIHIKVDIEEEIYNRFLDLFCKEIDSSEIREITKISIYDVTANREYFQSDLDDMLLQEDAWAKFPKENTHLFLAYNLNKEIVGFLVGQELEKSHEQVFHDHEPRKDELYQHIDEPHFYVHTLFIRKDYRKEGGEEPCNVRVGTQLMLEALKKTEDLGFRYLTLIYVNDETGHDPEFNKEVIKCRRFYNQLSQFGQAVINEKPYYHYLDWENVSFTEMSSVVFCLFKFNYLQGIKKLKQKLVSKTP